MGAAEGDKVVGAVGAIVLGDKVGEVGAREMGDVVGDVGASEAEGASVGDIVDGGTVNPVPLAAAHTTNPAPTRAPSDAHEMVDPAATKYPLS